MWKNIISYLWGTPKDLSLDEAYETLKVQNITTNEQEKVEKEPVDYICYHRTGIVTHVNGNEVTIDNLYRYNKIDNIVVGTKVSFICYTISNKVQISNVNIIDNEWNCVESNKISKWCNRSLIGKVVKRDERNIIIDPGNVIVNLDAVNSEFIPIIGDWLELDIISEIDENVTDLFGNILGINKINPLRPTILEGTIKTWNSTLQNGTINLNIFFNRESLSVGYIPSLKDKVVAEVIESHQGKCTWRALKVISISNGKINEVLNNFKTQYDMDNDIIRISNDLTIEFGKINDSTEFQFHISNLSNNDIILNDIIIENLSNQCKILDCLPKVINNSKTINILGECTVKTAGYSKELLIFSFNELKIGRWINISVKALDKFNDNHPRYNNRQNLMLDTRKFRSDKYKVVLKAPKPFVPARFIPYRLPDYQVPSKLWDIFLNFDDNKYLAVDDLKNFKPVLNQVLSYQNYEERFHTLLHLEEINSIIEIRKFDRDQVSFIPNAEYLMLEYQNLSEQRPSIIVGDTILAKDSFSDQKTCLEGYVYKVGSKHIYLKFHQRFHEEYKGEDCSVTVVQSRTQLKRMHQAVGLAIKNLGRTFLFPTQVITKEPQINFIYDAYKNIPITQKNCSGKTRLSNRELIKIISSNNENCSTNENNLATKAISKNIQGNTPSLKNIHKIPENGLNKLPLKLEWFDKSLNYYQKEAVRYILLGEARPLPYFIFGPPGTGKTVTLVETILQILRMAPSRILVATPSNSAANLISIRLINSGILKPGDLVRLVSYKLVNENNIPAILAPYCVTASVNVDGTGSNTSFVTDSGLTIGCNSKTIGKHRITVGTCASIGVLYSLAVSKGQFTHIIVDEAGQATEPEVMIPLSFLDILSGQCVLAGDPMQLGPVICSKYAAEFGLCESFMERLLNRFPYVRDIEGFPNTGGYDPRLVTKLVYNYRSLPGVLELPNSMFYYSELKPTILPDDSPQADMLTKFKGFLPKGNANNPPSFIFHGVEGENFQIMDSPSWFNPHEISQVFYYVNELYRVGCSSKDIGIITPYSKQTKEIKAVFTEAEFDLPKIGTVEEFQGQEFNAIILSTVRSSKNMLSCDTLYNLGFITQPKRLNVALTRAQVLTIVVGNPYLLINDSCWRYIIQHAVKNGCYCGCDIPKSFYDL